MSNWHYNDLVNRGKANFLVNDQNEAQNKSKRPGSASYMNETHGKLA